MPMYICDVCDKEFKQKTDYKRHCERQNPCKPDNNKNTEIELLKNNLVELTRTNIELVKRVESLEKEINKPKRVIINNNTNIINCQIVLAFGNEDTNFITDNMKIQILQNGLKSVQKYIELVHCNKDKPENKNIYISNRKNMNGSIMVYDGESWKLRSNDYIDTLRDKGIEFVEEQYEDFKNKNIHKHIIKMAERFVNKINNDNDDTFKNKITNDIKLILYNNRPT